MAHFCSLIFLGFAAFIAGVDACATGFEPFFDGKCFQVIAGSPQYYPNWKKKCTEEGALPATIRSQEENDALMGGFSAFENKHAIGFNRDKWIGLTCDVGKRKFVWEDGTIANYTNFADNYKCNANLYFYINTSNGKWYTTPGNGIDEIVCMQPRLTNYPCGVDMDLVTGNDGDFCVAVQSNASSWDLAEKKCLNASAHLISIHDETVNSYIRRSAIAQHLTNEIHIGAYSTNNTSFVWKDDSPMDFMKFYPGFPDVEEYGKCVAMQINSPFNGRWINVECDAKLAYACGRPAFNFSSSISSECPSEQPYRNGDSIYSPGFPGNVTAIMCDDYVLSAPKGKRIELTVVLFESNLCCDTLSIYDGLMATVPTYALRGVYRAGMTITSSTNSMRMTWNATNAMNIRGFHLEMREV